MCVDITNTDIDGAEKEFASPDEISMNEEITMLDAMLDPRTVAEAATIEYAMNNQDSVLFNLKGIPEEVLPERLGTVT